MKKRVHQHHQQVAAKLGFHFYLNLVFLTVVLFLLSLLPINGFYTAGDLVLKRPLVQATTVVLPSPAPYPTKVNGYPAPEVSTKGAIVVDFASGKVLYEKNGQERLYPASTTKILTALVALNYYSPQEVLTTIREHVDGSILGLKPGDRLSVIDFLKAALLPSANDAALVLADNYPGGETGFVAKMNEKAASLNMTDSHFQNPTGLHDPNHYSTPRDLVRLTEAVIKNPILKKIVATKKAAIYNLTTQQSIKIDNLNQLLGTTGVDGVKTGFTDEAGGCLIATKQLGKNRVVSVVLNSQDRFLDTDKLLSFVFNSYRWQDGPKVIFD